MTIDQSMAMRAARALGSAARVILGVFWIHEGWFKYSSGFGKADIGLVVSSSASNARVPGYFKPFASDVLGALPGLFGLLMPALEVGLGVVLVLGIMPRLTGLGSLFQLMTYWSADQLIWQYPVMALLSGVVAAFYRSSSAYTALTLWHRFTRSAD